MSRFLLALLLFSPVFPAVAQTLPKPMNSPPISVSRADSRVFSPAPAAYFTGEVRLSPLPAPAERSRLGGASVEFAAGTRTAWHTHPMGQTLVVTQGRGLVQSWGGPILEMRVGDVVQIAPGVKHWHGAAPGKTVDWLEKVSDEQYNPQRAEAKPSSAPQPSRAQALMGDIAPKLAQLTDDVLFGDVWERPGLSKRDRSLATVSALVALNRPDQLRSHLGRARENGVSEAELIEVITQMAFYAGWPSAISAIGVAREVFAAKP